MCRTIYATFKPARDSRVANRLIGAALGIRIPSNNGIQKQNKKTKSINETNSNSINLQDAWDD